MFEQRKKRRDPKKLTRLLPLFLLATLITTASAAVYNMMYIQGQQVAVETAKVYFVTGDDSTAAGASIGTNSTYVQFTSLAGWPNATRVYTQAVNITNGDAGSRTFSITFDSWSGDTGQVGSLLIKVFNDGGSQQGSTVTVGTPSSTTGDISIGAGDEYSLQIEILWTAGSLTSHDVSFTLTMTVNDE